MNNGKPSIPKDLLADAICKHCGETFRAARVPVIGQQGKQFQLFVIGLQKHLAEKHPQVIAEIAFTYTQFKGMLLLNQFQHADPQLNEEQDRTRHKVFKLCQRAVVSDATIEEKIRSKANWDAANNPNPLLKVSDAVELTKEMRDVLTEAFLYPDHPVIVVPGSNQPS